MWTYMDNVWKTSYWIMETKSVNNNRTLVNKMNFRATLLKAWLVSIVLLLVVGIVLLLCGAFFGSASKPLLIAGVICVSIAIPMVLFYIGVTRCRRRRNDICKEVTNGQIATIYPPEYYTQTPPGMKSDYPMGPLLIMTLPKSRESRSRRASGACNESTSSTPNNSNYRKMGPYRKNLPPLASEETLSPSLWSSSTGIDSVI